VQVPTREEIEAQEEARRRQAVAQLAQTQTMHESADVDSDSEGEAPDRVMPAVSHKVGRNEPCPCGSGKKYKQCHGKLS
jgi:Predicted metal-binding protein related to the C-terminal domain of SecA